MTYTQRIERVAEALEAQHAARARFEPLTGPLALDTLDEAYAAQRVLIQRWKDGARGPIAGYKVALTSKAVQELCGVDHPCVGAIFESTVYDSPARIPRADFVRLGLEFELCLRIGTSLPGGPQPYTAETVRDAIAEAVPAFELVEDRASDYSKLNAISLVADNCWCGGIVTGAATGDWRALDLTQTPVRLEYTSGGKAETETATTGAVLDSPLNVLAWVANVLAGQGRPLEAGMWVMTGSALRTRFAEAGDRAVYTIEGLGTVTIDVT
ncbi:putative hydratase [alpha proteobacterium BAL199]|jgi:2-keto-4-pentenoate hydratase|nr:putative hydratase [alpha proteobacterium BAL199]